MKPTQHLDKYEVFLSMEGTRYLLDRSQETVVRLTDLEVALLKQKVSLMSDQQILNRESGNGISMGIPIAMSQERLKDIHHQLVQVLKTGPLIDLEQHVIDRLVWDSLLPEHHPDKRGWEDEEDIKNCIYTARKIAGVRLNVNHFHRDNTEKVKHLYPHPAIVIEGSKASGNGRLVLVIFHEQSISVITIL